MTSASTDIETYLIEKQKMIDSFLETFQSNLPTPYSILYDAASFAMQGGKRLRPILTLATAEMLGGNLTSALTPACALELIHTYSLIHDDLPCMDNDDFRRGRPTLHRKFKESIALLVGDYLLTRAFELTSTAPGLSSQQRTQLTEILCFRAGSHGMLGGQVMDILSEGKKIDLSTLSEIHRRKTGELIIASVEFGAIVANATDEERLILKQFAAEVGLAFQIIDDVIDVTASVEKHGKLISSDEEKDKTTYVSLMGVDQARETALEHLSSGLKALSRLQRDPYPLNAIAERLVHRRI